MGLDFEQGWGVGVWRSGGVEGLGGWEGGGGGLVQIIPSSSSSSPRTMTKVRLCFLHLTDEKTEAQGS